jgi:poly(hydroxyalkanoate) depolymerase family esterase
MAGSPATGSTVGGITETIRQALAAAGLATHTGPMKGVTDVIEQALSAAGLAPGNARDAQGATIDGTAREIDPLAHPDAMLELREIAAEEPVLAPTQEPVIARPGEFLDCTFAGAAGARDYKLYLPATRAAGGLPMVVMLHGCTQSTDDFATGTRMNALADRHGFIVVYPAQCAKANFQKCWNWFRTEDQARESGEPAIIAGITREVAAHHGVDPRRIFVAGMSAGAAMAVILGATYPDLYAAVGAHSGLAYAAAHDMPSAFGAMQGAGGIRATIKPQGSADRAPPSFGVPTIVFHGDADRTVSARNASAIVEQAKARAGSATLRATSQAGTSTGGRAFSRTTYAHSENGVVVELWVVHGAGHAWSGGDSAGSFTDAVGPDASAEMIRFFLSQRLSGTA